MPEITITLVDHTSDHSGSLKDLIKREVSEIFCDLLHTGSEAAVVNIRWMSVSPAAEDQDLVLHFVENVTSSYISQKMPGKPHRPDGGGFTRTRGDVTGSEFYKFPLVNGQPARLTAKGYAKLAVHEAMHNITGLDNTGLHSGGGVAASPPQLPVNQGNRTLVQQKLGSIPKQLL